MTSNPPAESAQDALTERSARIVAAHKLLRRSRRLQTGEFLADGAQAVREAIASERDVPGMVRELFVTADAAARQVSIVRAALQSGIRVTKVTDRAAAKLSDAATPQGMTALCALPAGAEAETAAPDLARLLAGGPRLVAVLVAAADPGNAGSVIRLADAAGADAVIVCGESVDPYGPRAVRGSAGSIFHLPVLRAGDPLDVVRQLSDAGLAVMATTGAAETDLDIVSRDGLLALPTAWLFGSEAHGLPDDVIQAADVAVRVPIYGRAESLNLATAAALCLYASASAQRS